MLLFGALAMCLIALVARVQAHATIIDLSHPLSNQTLHWPTGAGFGYKVDVDAKLKDSANNTYDIKMDSFQTGIHTGTHLDAPRHFSAAGQTVEQIPLERLHNVHFTIVDLSAKVLANHSYLFERSDFESASEAATPLVSNNSVLLVYTGLSSLYQKGAAEYFGTDTKNMSLMRVPGFSAEAAKYVVDRGVIGVGMDAPSADSSQHHTGSNTLDPVAHVIFSNANVYILENLSNRLSELLTADRSSMLLSSLPLPIVAASGSPVRVVAMSLAHHEQAPATNDVSSLIARTNLLWYIASPIVLLFYIAML